MTQTEEGCETSSFLGTGIEIEEDNETETTSSNRWCGRNQWCIGGLLSAAIFMLGFMPSRRNATTKTAAAAGTTSNIEATHSVPHGSFISEYNFIRTFSTYYKDAYPFQPPFDSNYPIRTRLNPDIVVSTPMQFETAIRAMGVTDKEYADCASSIHQDPDRKICTKLDNLRCYVEADSEHDAPIKTPCPTGFIFGKRNNYDKWDPLCYGPGQGKIRYDKIRYDSVPYLCYMTATCLEQASQWSTNQIQVKFNDYKTWVNPGWNGGLKADEPIFGLNMTRGFDVSTAIMQTEPYQGKLCLQKAALKALSRNGWELTDPSTAFTSEYWTVIKKTPV